MQSPVKIIKDLLYENWSLEDDLDKDNMEWRFGEPDDPSTRFVAKEMSMEFGELTTPRDKRSLTRSIARTVVTVDFWRKYNIAKSKEQMETDRQDVVDEVDKIISANEISAVDLDLVYVAVDRPLDEPEERIIRSQIEIVCVYQK